MPVGAERTCEMLREQVDEVTCALFPEPFRAVHQGYRDFSQTPDDEVHRPAASRLVLSLLSTSKPTHRARVPSSRQPGTVSNPSRVKRPSDGRCPLACSTRRHSSVASEPV